MATVKFLIKGKSKINIIYVRVRDGRKTDLTSSTHLTIEKQNWSTPKNWISQRASFKDKKNLENELKDLERLIFLERNNQICKGFDLNSKWLKSVILKSQGINTNVSDLIIDLLIAYKEYLPSRVVGGKKGVADGTIRNYNTTIQRLRKYENHYGFVLNLNDIDLNFHTQYMKFANEILGLSLNSIGKDIKQIKTVCLDAKDKGLTINPQVISRKFSSPSEKTIFTTLSVKELELIDQFSGSDYLENARDWLMIGCWTGCRVGDLMMLTESNIVEHSDGKKVIQYVQSKTGKVVNVPIHPTVARIIKNLSGFPRPISDVKFNKYIKELCKKAGLTYEEWGSRQNPKTHKKETGNFQKWELIKSHTCRRSFATNHYSKFPNKLIMAVTGHSTERMLLSYIGETEIEHVDDFLKFWEK